MNKKPVITSFTLLMMLCLLPACSRGPRNFSNDNDRLRAENLELRREIEKLQAAAERREGQLAATRQQLDGAQPLPGVEPPALAKLTYDRYTGPVDTDGDGLDDAIRLYVKPLDQHGRVIPIEGKGKLTAVFVGKQSPPVSFLEKWLDAKDIRAAYRSGITGTHYTFELPIDDRLETRDADEATVTFRFTDAATGAEHKVSKSYNVTY